MMNGLILSARTWRSFHGNLDCVFISSSFTGIRNYPRNEHLILNSNRVKPIVNLTSIIPLTCYYFSVSKQIATAGEKVFPCIVSHAICLEIKGKNVTDKNGIARHGYIVFYGLRIL